MGRRNGLGLICIILSFPFIFFSYYYARSVTGKIATLPLYIIHQKTNRWKIAVIVVLQRLTAMTEAAWPISQLLRKSESNQSKINSSSDLPFIIGQFCYYIFRYRVRLGCEKLARTCVMCNTDNGLNYGCWWQWLCQWHCYKPYVYCAINSQIEIRSNESLRFANPRSKTKLGRIDNTDISRQSVCNDTKA